MNLVVLMLLLPVCAFFRALVQDSNFALLVLNYGLVFWIYSPVVYYHSKIEKKHLYLLTREK